MTEQYHRGRYATRGDLDALRETLLNDLQGGRILIPPTLATTPNYAGGVSHCPNSDLSYSKQAATVPGTLPGDAGDANYEAYRFYRQLVGANLDLSAPYPLKASGHSLYAASEGADSQIPVWDRTYGWVALGSAGADQYDIAIQLLNKPIGPGQRWFVLFRIAALDSTPVPADLEVRAGIWQRGTTEGYAKGSPFDLSHTIVGAPGSTSIDYRVLAKTDSGVEILSNILNVPNAPNTLSASNYVKLFYHAGPGFIEFDIYRKVGSVYTFLFTVRNTIDFEYNDTNNTDTHRPATAWPAAVGDSPEAVAQTRNLIIGSYNSEWKVGELTINIPSTYDSSQTDSDGQFLRITLTTPTATNRQLGIDRIVLDSNFHEWSPDAPIVFSDGTTAVPTVSPPSGPQGGSGGLFTPPSGGSGGSGCPLLNTPILTGGKWKQLRSVRLGDGLKGDQRLPYSVLRKKTGVVSEYILIRTKNGITMQTSRDHRYFLDIHERRKIEAQHIQEGKTQLACWVKGRKTKTLVIEKRVVPSAAQVGTFTLRDATGIHPDGEGVYIAGRSKKMDRGLFNSNLKLPFDT